MRTASLRRTALLALLGLFLATCAAAQQQPVELFPLNGYKRVLDGQWEGIRYASDGNVYFASSTHSAHHGASFFKYNPLSNQITVLAEDITVICGEDPQTNPQGKIHSDIVEADGWLYFTTHFSSELPGAYQTWSGSHLIGYELATGVFRDYGVIHPNYTSYSAIGVDPVRHYLYAFVTGEDAGQVSYLYRIDTTTGAKTNLGQVGGQFAQSFYLFVDSRGDGWFSVSSHGGDLFRVRGATGQIDVFPNALPPLYQFDAEQLMPPADQALREIFWMQPLDGDRALLTVGWYGGMLYEFNSSTPIESGQAFTALRHIGHTELGLALSHDRVFYYQRADGAFGQQEFDDFHLLSVSLTEAGHPITDYGLMTDGEGRLAWRLPSMATDGGHRVFMTGDWWTLPTDLGTLRYTYDYDTGDETYEQLPRGEFFAVATIAAPPTVVLTTPADGATVLPVPIDLAADAIDDDDAVAGVAFLVDGSVIGSDSTAPYEATWNAPSSGAHVLTARATDAAGHTTTSAAVRVTVGTVPATAAFVGVDGSTKGSWRGVYGTSGYAVVNHATSLPPFAQVSDNGTPSWTWAGTTSDVRALQKATGVDRVASTLYTASTSSFTIDVALNDAATHRLALYALDWETNARRQRVEVLDARTGTVLDSRDMAGFSGGQYLVWRVTGSLRLRVTYLAGPNAVLSGLFLDPDGSAPASNAPPSVTLTEPAAGGAFTAPSSVRVKANASDGDGTIAKVEFFVDNASVGIATAAPYEVDWSAPSAGPHTLFARATDDDGAVADSANVGVTINAAPTSGTSAVFLGPDTVTQGSWRNVYGRAGYLLVNNATSLPSFATVTPGGPASWTWQGLTSDLRALQKPTGPDRVAATWYTAGASSFTIDVTISDGQPHRLSLYALDWDTNARRQRVEVFNPSTGALLDSRDMSSFNGGQYLTWRVIGSVRIKATLLAGQNAVVSGLFFDPDGAGPAPNLAPSVTLTEPASGASLTVPPAIRLKATAADSDGTIAKVEFFTGSTLIGTATTAPYEVDWTSPAPGPHTLMARATDDDGAVTDSATVSISVGSAPAPGGATSASFLGVDTTTQGSWRNVYGRSGYTIVNNATSLPAFAQVTPSGPASWTWAAVTGDVRALQKPSGPDRIAATWYTSGTSSFTIDVALTDGQFHQISLYVLDWDTSARRQRIEILDSATGVVLDSRDLASFGNGCYLVWRVKGSVRLRVTHLAGFNGVVSGLFIDPDGALPEPNVPPTVSLTEPSGGSTFTSPASIHLKATASDPDGSVANVQFFAGSTPVGTASAPPFEVDWSNPPTGTHTLVARATDDDGVAADSAGVTITVSSSTPASGNSAAFLGPDGVTQGTWRTVYGRQGYALAAGTSSLPASVQAAVTGTAAWTWTGATTDVRALQKPSGNERAAATWYTPSAGGAFTVDINVTDAQAHRVALYALDWDTSARQQRIEVFDGATGVLLDSRDLSSFAAGRYFVWRVTGHVRIQITHLAGFNAVLAGVFIDPDSP